MTETEGYSIKAHAILLTWNVPKDPNFETFKEYMVEKAAQHGDELSLCHERSAHDHFHARGKIQLNRLQARVLQVPRRHAQLLHIVAPSLCENSLALIHGVNALRHRALAASRCPEPRLCRMQPAIEGR